MLDEKQKQMLPVYKPDNTQNGSTNNNNNIQDLYILVLWIIMSLALYPTHTYCSYFVISMNCILFWCLVAYNYGWQNLFV